MNHRELTDWEQSKQRLVKPKIFSQTHGPTARPRKAPHPTRFMRKKGSASQSATFLTCLLAHFRSSGLPVWLPPDFQLQQVNKLLTVLLIIAGTFHRYSEISLLIHCRQTETLHISSSYMLLFIRLAMFLLLSSLLNRFWPS